MVSVRLSPDEYLRCRQACRERGARNISELARTALQDMFTRGPAAPDAQLRELRDRVQGLSDDIERLTELFGTDRAVSTSANGGIS